MARVVACRVGSRHHVVLLQVWVVEALRVEELLLLGVYWVERIWPELVLLACVATGVSVLVALVVRWQKSVV